MNDVADLARLRLCIGEIGAALSPILQRKTSVRFGITTADNGGSPPTIDVDGRTMRYIETSAGAPPVGDPVVVFQDEPSVCALGVLSDCIIEHLGTITPSITWADINSDGTTLYGGVFASGVIYSWDLTSPSLTRSTVYTSARSILSMAYDRNNDILHHTEISGSAVFLLEDGVDTNSYATTVFGSDNSLVWTPGQMCVVFGGTPTTRNDRVTFCTLATGGTLTEVSNAGTLPVGAGSITFGAVGQPSGGVFFYYGQASPQLDELWHVTAGGTFTTAITSGTFFGDAINVDATGALRFMDLSGTPKGVIVGGSAPFTVADNGCSPISLEPSSFATQGGSSVSDFSSSIVVMDGATPDVYRVTV